VTLAAIPAAGSVFRGLSGGGCVGAEPCPLALTTDTTVTATFSGDLVNVAANRPQFTAGRTLRVAMSVNDPGGAATVDFLFGVLLPDGQTVVFLTPRGPVFGRLADPTTFRPIAAGVSLGAPIAVTVPDILVYTWTGQEPHGAYVLFLAAIRAGAVARGTIGPGDLIGLSKATVVLGP